MIFSFSTSTRALTMLRILLTASFAIGLIGVASAADEKYSIIIPKDKKGDKTANDKTEESKNLIAVNFMGMDNKQDEVGGRKESYTEEILAVKAGERKAIKLTRTYTTAEKTAKGETAKRVYAGKTVLIEKKGEKYEFSIDGKPLAEADAPELYKSYNKDKDEPDAQDLMPAEAIKVGDGWKVPADKSEKMFKTLGDEKMKVDPKKSTIAGKLVKAYKKDGAQYGVFELTITVAVAELDLGSGLAKATGTITVTGTMDGCIDGTVNAGVSVKKTTIDIAADLPNNGSFKMTGTATETDKAMAIKK